MQLVDNFLEKELFLRTFKHLHSEARWRQGWYSLKGGKLQHFNYSIADREGGKTRKDEQDFLTGDFQTIWEVIKAQLPEDHVLLRCYANLMTFGMEGLPHRDSRYSEDITTIIYYVKPWKPEFGGETLIYRRGEVDYATLPRANRMIQFPAAALHRVSPVGRMCFENPRITLMYKSGPEGLARDDVDGNDGA